MNISNLRLAFLLSASTFVACSSAVPEPHVVRYKFPPKNAFTGDAKRKYEKLGVVRTKVNYATLSESHDEDDLCKNYFNKGVQDLLKMAKDKGGDAVIKIRSVTFLMDGRTEVYSSPQCVDEGASGQVLVEAIAVKWLPTPEPSPTPSVTH